MKVYLQTFGCRANQYDTETVRAMAERSGAVVVESPAAADVAIFNSCAVTAEAEVDLRKAIRRAARANPQMQSLVMGCAASLDRGALAALPTVAHVVAGADFGAIADRLGLAPSALGPAQSQAGTRALLRIQDGCDEHCTFCATTLARGGNRSRPLEELVREAERLAERHREIVLTGVHIGTYGRDGGSTLGALVARLVRDVSAVRFRLSSVEASEVDPALAAQFDNPERLVPHLHAPLQSGSDRVLRRMGRHWYTRATYAAAIERLLANRPVFGLGADLIAGFPGERPEDHQATLDLVRDLPFTYLHVFPYSPRPGTAAGRLADPVPSPVMAERAQALRALGVAKAAAYRARRDGGPADVVVIRGDTREGLTEDYLTVRVAHGVGGRGTRHRLTLRREDDTLAALPAAVEALA